jgi:hypothetical protein
VVKTYYLANSDAKTVGTTLKTILKTRDIVVDEKLNMLMIRDSLEAVRMADKLVALQDIPEPEVMLEVEILEVKRTRLQALGINWPDNIALRALPVDGLTLKQLSNITSETTGVTVGPVIIRANQTDSDVNLLANPRIRARNREKAKILIGDRVPNITSTITATGFSSESITYIDVGLKLDFEPTIYLDNEVAIKVTLEVSNIVDKITTKTGTVALPDRHAHGDQRAAPQGRREPVAGRPDQRRGPAKFEQAALSWRHPDSRPAVWKSQRRGDQDRDRACRSRRASFATSSASNSIWRSSMAAPKPVSVAVPRAAPVARRSVLRLARRTPGSPAVDAGDLVAARGWRHPACRTVRFPHSQRLVQLQPGTAVSPIRLNRSCCHRRRVTCRSRKRRCPELVRPAFRSVGAVQLLWQGPTQLKAGDTICAATGDAGRSDRWSACHWPSASILACCRWPMSAKAPSSDRVARRPTFSYRVDPGGQVLLTATRSGAGGASAVRIP